jgi:hypothetical protein
MVRRLIQKMESVCSDHTARLASRQRNDWKADALVKVLAYAIARPERPKAPPAETILRAALVHTIARFT